MEQRHFRRLTVVTVLMLVAVMASAREIESKSVTNFRLVRTIRCLVTAYCPCRKCCGKFADGRTSQGRNAWRTYGAAAYPRAIPYGWVASINGVGYRLVDDTGGAMKKSWLRHRIFHIDVRFHSHKKALEWGRKWMNVHLYRPH